MRPFMNYSVSTLAMIVFFACVAIIHFFGGPAALELLEALAAAVAAIALTLHK